MAKSDLERRTKQVSQICEGWSFTAFKKLGERTPTPLVAMIWGVGFEFVRNGAIVAWDFSAADLDRFKLLLSRSFVDWFVAGIGDSTPQTVDAANQVFSAACDEAYVLRGMVWAEQSILEGLRDWSGRSGWGRSLLDTDDGLIGGFSLLTLTGVVEEVTKALKSG